MSDREVIDYLVEHFDDIGVGAPSANLAETLIAGINSGSRALEKRDDAFAIIVKANRTHEGKHGGLFAAVQIPPEADLSYVMVVPEERGKGVGFKLIEEVKAKYMEGQAMTLVCAGADRRQRFEKLGFHEYARNEQGHYLMSCKLAQ